MVSFCAPSAGAAPTTHASNGPGTSRCSGTGWRTPPSEDGVRSATVRVDSPIGRVVQRVAGSRPFAAVAPKVVPPLDRFVHRLTGGRIILSEGLLPGLMLTTTGHK